jgi:hypothetical protein
MSHRASIHSIARFGAKWMVLPLLSLIVCLYVLPSLVVDVRRLMAPGLTIGRAHIVIPDDWFVASVGEEGGKTHYVLTTFSWKQLFGDPNLIQVIKGEQSPSDEIEEVAINRALAIVGKGHEIRSTSVTSSRVDERVTRTVIILFDERRCVGSFQMPAHGISVIGEIDQERLGDFLGVTKSIELSVGTAR